MLRNTGQGFGLLVSLMRRQRHDVRTVSIPVVKIWQDDTLPLSEILVTLLAQSLTEQGGLNIIEGGGQKGLDAANLAGRRAEAHETVCGEFSYLKDNAGQTVAEIDKYNQLADEMEALRIECQPSNVQPAQTLTDDLKSSYEALDAVLEHLEVVYDDMIQQADAEIGRLVTKVSNANNVNAIMEELVEFAKVDDADPSMLWSNSEDRSMLDAFDPDTSMPDAL